MSLAGAVNVKAKKAAIQTPTRVSTARYGITELRRRIAELKVKLAEGKTDLECCEELELNVQEYNTLKREMYAQEKIELIGKSTEEVFVDYIINQKKCIKDLDELIPLFKGGNQPNAIVGAVKAKSDIFNKIIETGQTFGIIEKIPEKKQIVGGIMVAQLDNNELRRLITEQLHGLQQVVGRYGNTDLFGNPIDGDPIPKTGLPQAEETEDVRPAAMEPPRFTANGGKPQNIGGAKKAAGARAVNAMRRVKATTAPPEE